MTSALVVEPPIRQAPSARPPLIPIPHSADAMDGIPYFDEELQMAQSDAHRDTVVWLCTVLDSVAESANLKGVSDYPIWYWIPEVQVQRVLYPDYALVSTHEIKALTAAEILLGLEVVTTTRADKELKDSVQMHKRSEANQIPEFVLVYPEPEDRRALRWFRYDHLTAAYREVPIGEDSRYRSAAVPGLEIAVLDPADWTPGQKLRVFYRGQEVLGVKEARRQAEVASFRAQAASIQAEEERQARELAEERANRYLALLQRAGIEP